MRTSSASSQWGLMATIYVSGWDKYLYALNSSWREYGPEDRAPGPSTAAIHNHCVTSAIAVRDLRKVYCTLTGGARKSSPWTG